MFVSVTHMWLSNANKPPNAGAAVALAAKIIPIVLTDRKDWTHTKCFELLTQFRCPFLIINLW